MPSPRAILLNVSLYASLILIMILALPTLVLPRAVLMRVVRWWGRFLAGACSREERRVGAQNRP